MVTTKESRTIIDTATVGLETKAPSSQSLAWVGDGGASAHMSNEKEVFHFIQPLPTPCSVIIANNDELPIEGVGPADVVVTTEKEEHQTIHLKRCFYIPTLGKNLLSLILLMKAGTSTNFNAKRQKVLMDIGATGEHLVELLQIHGLPIIYDTRSMEEIRSQKKLDALTAQPSNLTIIPSFTANIAEQWTAHGPKSRELWHNRLAHVNYNIVDHLPAKVDGMEIAKPIRDDSTHNCHG